MLRLTGICAALVAAAVVCPPFARASEKPNDTQVTNQVTMALPNPAVLTAIVDWLAKNFDLPAFDDLPRIERVSATRLVAVHYRTLVAGRASEATAAHAAAAQVIAVYDSAARIIFVGQDWRGETPADVSILVHEMVHHLQELAGLKYACPQEREKLAYAAQDQWLRQFGGNLLDDFEMDGLWLLARTNCLD
jgi:hypothetical protein